MVGEGGVVGSFSFDREPGAPGIFLRRAGRPRPGVPARRWAAAQTQPLTRLNHDLLRWRSTWDRWKRYWIKGPRRQRPAGLDPQAARLRPGQEIPLHPGDPRRAAHPVRQVSSCTSSTTWPSKGYVVYFCNPRGGRGYGEAHAKAHLGRLGHRRLRRPDGLDRFRGQPALHRHRAHGRHRRQLRRLHDRLDHRAYPALQSRGHPALREQFHQHVGLQRLQLESSSRR